MQVAREVNLMLPESDVLEKPFSRHGVRIESLIRQRHEDELAKALGPG